MWPSRLFIARIRRFLFHFFFAPLLVRSPHADRQTQNVLSAPRKSIYLFSGLTPHPVTLTVSSRVCTPKRIQRSYHLSLVCSRCQGLSRKVEKGGGRLSLCPIICNVPLLPQRPVRTSFLFPPLLSAAGGRRTQTLTVAGRRGESKKCRKRGRCRRQKSVERGKRHLRSGREEEKIARGGEEWCCFLLSLLLRAVMEK